MDEYWAFTWRLALAVGIGAGLTASESFIFAMLTGRAWNLPPILEGWHMAITAAPFLVLALLSAKKVMPWAVAMMLTFIVWGWWLFDTVSHHSDGSEVKIGSVMLLGAPFAISLAAAFVHFATQRVRPRT